MLCTGLVELGSIGTGRPVLPSRSWSSSSQSPTGPRPQHAPNQTCDSFPRILLWSPTPVMAHLPTQSGQKLVISDSSLSCFPYSLHPVSPSTTPLCLLLPPQCTSICLPANRHLYTHFCLILLCRRPPRPPAIFKSLSTSLSCFRISTGFPSAHRISSMSLGWVCRPCETWRIRLLLALPTRFSASPTPASLQGLGSASRPVHLLFSAWCACPPCHSLCVIWLTTSPLLLS